MTASSARRGPKRSPASTSTTMCSILYWSESQPRGSTSRSFPCACPACSPACFYLWVVFRMARRWFGDGLPFLAVIGLLTLNPLVVDALSEARGYGMALACWMWALELILESVQSFSAAKLNLAAMCLGLSVAASLAFAAPAVCLTGRLPGVVQEVRRSPEASVWPCSCAHRLSHGVCPAGHPAQSRGVENTRRRRYQLAPNHQ